MKGTNMTNNTKIELTSEELKGILEEYYSKELKKAVSLNIHADKKWVDYCEDTHISIHMTFIAKERIGSKEVGITYTIEQKDIEETLNELLREKGYVVGRVDYNAGKQNGTYTLTSVTINLIERRKNMYLTKQYYGEDK